MFANEIDSHVLIFLIAHRLCKEGTNYQALFDCEQCHVDFRKGDFIYLHLDGMTRGTFVCVVETNDLGY